MSKGLKSHQVSQKKEVVDNKKEEETKILDITKTLQEKVSGAVADEMGAFDYDKEDQIESRQPRIQDDPVA